MIFQEKFQPTCLLDTYSTLLVYYISRKIPGYSLIRAYSFIEELRVAEYDLYTLDFYYNTTEAPYNTVG